MIDYNKVLSPAIMGMKPSGIRKFFDIAQQLEGVISLGVGEPDFKTPYVVRREAINVLEKGRTLADNICTETGIDISTVLSALTLLELEGIVNSLPGNQFELAD